MTFKSEQIALLAASGWSGCESVAATVAAAGLPAVTSQYLSGAFSDDLWEAAQSAVLGLGALFGSARYADEVTYGIVLVPDPGKLDTRQPVAAGTRRDQLGAPVADVFDERLSAGVRGVRSGAPWVMVATVTGTYGPSMGSYNQIVTGRAVDFVVGGVDARALMIRQVWGARVLQSGRELPDCESNHRWTFTLFPGEGLTDGCAESGTILKGKVRFRLGKPDRGIGSARVAPALAVR